MGLTVEQWNIVKDILPEDPVREDRRGRPWGDRRKVLEGVLWILRTGARWQDLPPRYGPYQTAHRRFQNWVKLGVLEHLLLTLAQHLKDAGVLDLKECFVDGTFVPAKKRGDWWGKPSGARAPRSWALRTTMVFLPPCGLNPTFEISRLHPEAAENDFPTRQINRRLEGRSSRARNRRYPIG